MGAGYAAKFLVVSGVAMNMKILAYAAPFFTAPVACLAALFTAAASLGNDLEGTQWLKRILLLDSVRFKLLDSRVHMTLKLALSVDLSVCPFVGFFRR